MRRIVALLPLLAAALLTGCSTQRSLPMVREQGDKAFERGDYTTACSDYAEYVERKPGDPEVQYLYAKSLLKTNQPIPAVEHATIAFDQKPTNEDYINTRAEALFQAGKTDELYRFLRGQTEARGLPADYIRLGQYTARLGDADGAEHALLMAAKIDGGRTAAPQLALADFYRSIGHKEKEITRLRMALYLDPKNAQITQRLRALGEIPGPSLALPPADSDQ